MESFCNQESFCVGMKQVDKKIGISGHPGKFLDTLESFRYPGQFMYFRKFLDMWKLNKHSGKLYGHYGKFMEPVLDHSGKKFKQFEQLYFIIYKKYWVNFVKNNKYEIEQKKFLKNSNGILIILDIFPSQTLCS